MVLEYLFVYKVIFHNRYQFVTYAITSRIKVIATYSKSVKYQ